MPGDRFLELVSASDRKVLDTLFRHAREGITVQGPDGLIYANDRAAHLVGLETGDEMVATPPAELLARFDVVDPDGNPFDWDRLPGRRVLAGEEPEEVTMGYRLDGSRLTRWSRVNASPIKNDVGEVVWAINFFLDITDQFQQRDRERIVARVSEALSTSLHMTPNLRALNEIIVPELASWCAFHILDEFDNLIPDAVAFPESDDSKRLFDLADLGPISRGADQMQSRVLATGKTEYIPRITEEMLETAEETRGKDFVAILRGLAWRSVLCVPLGFGDAKVGTMTLIRTRTDRGFQPSELALIEEIALRAGAALVNAQTFESEFHTAEALRRGLRPTHLPDVPGLKATTRYRPVERRGHVGGDFYDLIAIDEDRCIALVGDIEGKGVEAAAAVGLVRQTLKATISLDTDPAVVLRQLNDSLRSEGSTSRMCTLGYVTLQRQAKGFTGQISLAGHPPPVIIRCDGSLEEVGEACPPAGLFEELVPKPRELTLEPGDTMILYTDGLAAEELTAPETVVRMVEGIDHSDPERLLEMLMDEFLDEVPVPRDDIALLALRVTD